MMLKLQYFVSAALASKQKQGKIYVKKLAKGKREKKG